MCLRTQHIGDKWIPHDSVCFLWSLASEKEFSVFKQKLQLSLAWFPSNPGSSFSWPQMHPSMEWGPFWLVGMKKVQSDPLCIH